MAESTSDRDQRNAPLTDTEIANRKADGRPVDQRLTDQQIADRNRGGLVTITVDGHEYQVQPGAHSMSSLTNTAVLINPPNLHGAKALHSRKGEKYHAQDTINIEGGEVFVTTPGGPAPLGVVADNRTAEQRASDEKYGSRGPIPAL
jgi:hypothetical protein